jgi:PAS domain S-box-containing protein
MVEGGEMASLIQARDWAATPAGAIQDWPQSLRTALQIVLQLRQPAALCVGPDAILLYNCEYRRLLGRKHPDALGKPFLTVWSELEHVVAPAMADVMAGKPQLWEDARFELGGLAEGLTPGWFTASWTPVRLESGAVGGFMVVATETSALHVAEMVRAGSEAALRESDERYRTLLESIEEAYAVIEVLEDEQGNRTDFRILDVNPAFTHHTGLRDPIGKTAIELVGRPNPRWLQLYGQMLETGSPLRVKERDVRQGRVFDLNIFALDRERNRVAVLFTNVTDRERAEHALRESEELYRLIVENATDYAIFISDPEDRIVEWLPGAQAVFGWTRNEVIGRPAAIIFTPQDRDAGAPEWEVRTAAEEGVAPDVRWHQRKDGGHVFIEGSVTPLRHADGSIRGYLKIGQDVSVRRSAQEALEASERRMRALVTGIPQMVFRSWSSGERIWGSPQWIEYTGLDFEKSLGFGWLDAVHPHDRKTSMDAWGGVEERGEYYVEHRILKSATGEYRWHQTRAIPSRADDGRVLEWLGTSNDIEEIRQLYRHQQVLLGELQHRVRNTLGVVRSIARRTAELSADKDELAAHLQGRLAAFSRVQAAVTRTPVGGVELKGILEDELVAHAAREGEAVALKGPDVRLKPRPA